MGLALEQLEKYMTGTVDGGKYSIKRPGPAGAFEVQFGILYGDMVFVVIYCTPSPGVVTYSIHQLKEEETCPETMFEYVRNKKLSPIPDTAAEAAYIPIFAPVPVGGGQSQFSYGDGGGGWFWGYGRFCNSVC